MDRDEAILGRIGDTSDYRPAGLLMVVRKWLQGQIANYLRFKKTVQGGAKNPKQQGKRSVQF